jgi:hypothetical protein
MKFIILQRKNSIDSLISRTIDKGLFKDYVSCAHLCDQATLSILLRRLEAGELPH